MSKLSDKQEMFCLEYLIDLNATQAAVRAGYSEKTATSIGSENLSKPYIQERISELKSKRNERVEINSDWVLSQLVDIHNLDVVDILDNVGNFKPIVNWPKSWRMYLSGFDLSELNTNDVETTVRKIKWPDKVKNLELIGKHVDVQAFKERVDTNVSGDLKVEQTLTERLTGGSKR
jgi:phage terminase small subunit